MNLCFFLWPKNNINSLDKKPDHFVAGSPLYACVCVCKPPDGKQQMRLVLATDVFIAGDK